ncbi:MAG: RnfH family protein [Methylococcales bacterium]
MRVEVVYARAERQALLEVQVEAGSSVQCAIQSSGILDLFPEIDLARNRVGIFGVVCALEQKVQSGDRVEIYRPLIQDPKEARRRRATKKLN